jgi:hypothetical protein
MLSGKDRSAKDWQTAKNLLNEGKSNSRVAECLISPLEKQKGLTVSVGCFAAKDRTGFVVARVMIKNMVENIGKKFRKKAMQELTGQALQEGSVVLNVINENKKQRAAQFDPLSAFQDGGLKAGFSHIGRAAMDKIKPVHKK